MSADSPAGGDSQMVANTFRGAQRLGRFAMRGPKGIDYRRVLRLTWYGLIAVVLVMTVAYTPWNIEWAGVDFGRYLAGSRGLFAGDAYTDTGFLYSPAFAVLVSPFALLPFPVALMLWRVLELVALTLAIRGQPLALLVLVMPWLWASELLAGNMMGFATAAMIAVVRWPSVRTVALYAVMVAIVPKPSFLPVLVYGFVMVPEARRWVVGIGLAGLAMLAWPGYLNAALFGSESHLAPQLWPEPWAKIAAGTLTLAGLRWPRLLGPASVLAAAYAWPYLFMPLGLLFVSGSRRDHLLDVGVVLRRRGLRAVHEQDASVA